MPLSEQDRAVLANCSRGICLNISEATIKLDDLAAMFKACRAQGREEARREVKAWSTEKPPEKPGAYITVRELRTYRWLPYKPDGVRQMKRPGRWQGATEYGWENAPLPEGVEWQDALTNQAKKASHDQG